MKEQLSLTVQSRAEKGKGPNRRLRAEKMVPGIFYDDKGTNIPVVVADLPFRKLYQKVGSSHVFDLVIEKDGVTQTHPSLIWVVQAHPWKNQVDHVDFYGIDPNKPVHIHVAVKFTGKAKGVTVGGKLEIYRESLEVVCLPAAIPDEIVIDVTELNINQHISVKDLALPEGVKAVFDQNFAVVGVINPAAEAEAEAAK
ncbi:50S ribosomal protein L25/general stress protein Ctc [Fundidesulfovibrio terrae]|uniref:50S ribosomal protein L25/general stress protein Ctc n=1 Tax=Fundidesulfovibrio terrae TaxID=2922866 RepID=UPI001FAFD6DA|nr:50S ribosomal protein L25/general stress protein Ctc [Fundidesulfovibrio terrae]